VSDIDTVAVDSLKALDPKRPIREADIKPAPASEAGCVQFLTRRLFTGPERLAHTRPLAVPYAELPIGWRKLSIST
jgi:hypothetical protein